MSDSLLQPSAPIGALGVVVKLAFRVKLLRKTGPVLDSLLSPSALSAAICPLGVGVKRLYGFPPSNSPQPSSYVDAVDVVRIVLTRRRGSADC